MAMMNPMSADPTTLPGGGGGSVMGKEGEQCYWRRGENSVMGKGDTRDLRTGG